MISPFLKKLLFVRQFSMENGSIEILGKKQILLPIEVVYEIEKNATKPLYKPVRDAIKNDIADYAKILGSSDQGMLNNIFNIFESFGLGKLEIVTLDNKKKTGIVRVSNPPIKNGIAAEADLTSAILSGTFSFVFKKDVLVEKIKQKNPRYDEYVMK